MARSKAKAKSKKQKQKQGSDRGGLDPDEYFVERIVRAKVNVVQKNAVHWHYLVKWKGYDDPSEDTWEPAHSFEESKHFLEDFWEDTDLKGKDYENPKDWTRGAVVRRISASRRASASTRRKSQRESSPQGEESEVESILDKEKQESERSPSPPPPKRGRASRKTVLSLSRKSARGKAAASESPQRKSASTISLRKRKATEEVDESAPEDDGETSEKPVVMVPVKIGPPSKKKRQLKKRFTGPDKSTTNDPPHQDPETQALENDATNTPKGGSTPVIAGTPVRRQVQAGQFGSLSREAHSPSDIPNPPDHSDKATSATPPPRPIKMPRTPQHRHRAANPRVRPMNMDELPDAPGEKVDHMEKAISAKAKLAGGERKSSSEASSNKRQSTNKKKPGPGRSSYGLVSSQDDTLVNDENPLPPTTDADEDMEEGDENRPPQGGEITKEELMNMVGLREDEVNNLPDFNDEPMDVETEVVQTTVTEITVESVQEGPANQEKPISKPSLFGKPSIFGPLSIGAGSSRNIDRNAYALRLDTSVDVSVILQDMKPGSGSGPVTTLDLKEIFAKTPSAAPGKFYNPDAGNKLLSTLKTGGPCARVELMPGEDEEHEQNWEKFRDRLENKDSFVTGAGLHILILVASSNLGACEALGVPDVLTGLRREIIVSATDIEDPSRYSDAADLADNSRWL